MLGYFQPFGDSGYAHAIGKYQSQKAASGNQNEWCGLFRIVYMVATLEHTWRS
ncbi:hypothetical protein P8H26_17305 [Pseudochrobactrum sp. sp1633]|uniref:hypothetical protein n=1 Tax=Pseudochrobactrum sp. sp1633 TaxID=3036706 RepID=UPI0025A647F2|nr:hypothetical protein [Pseudochrobactrum sp. sp1633]MDM8347143.1 hypothetical protein [Pseudochrobactrum sp. sp1633]HWD13269.1 hypothetical protein [Pseudochrobactrum sp.]